MMLGDNSHKIPTYHRCQVSKCCVMSSCIWCMIFIRSLLNQLIKKSYTSFDVKVGDSPSISKKYVGHGMLPTHLPQGPLLREFTFSPKNSLCIRFIVHVTKKNTWNQQKYIWKIPLAFIITLVKKIKNIAKQLEKYAINRYI
jgi:hypothetical protein